MTTADQTARFDNTIATDLTFVNDLKPGDVFAKSNLGDDATVIIYTVQDKPAGQFIKDDRPHVELTVSWRIRDVVVDRTMTLPIYDFVTLIKEA